MSGPTETMWGNSYEPPADVFHSTMIPRKARR